MIKIPNEWEEYVQDKEYLLQLLNPKFVEVEGLIILEAHYNPETLQQWLSKSKENPEKLENTLNHVHLEYFAENSELQRDIGENLQIHWKNVLQQIFPDKAFEVNLVLVNKDWELQLWTKRN